MLSGCPVGENWIISSSSDREASGASATLWLGMRVMALLSRRAAARGQGTVTGKDDAAAGTVTGDRAVRRRSPPGGAAGGPGGSAVVRDGAVFRCQLGPAVPRAGRTVLRA